MRFRLPFLSGAVFFASAAVAFGAVFYFHLFLFDRTLSLPLASAQTTPYHYECGSGNTAGLCLRVTGLGSQDTTCGGGCQAGNVNNASSANSSASSGASCAFSSSDRTNYFQPDPTGTSDYNGLVTHYNNVYYATSQAAQQLAACTGGTVVTLNEPFTSAPNSPFHSPPTLQIQYPNGRTENAGYLIDRYLGYNGGSSWWNNVNALKGSSGTGTGQRGAPSVIPGVAIGSIGVGAIMQKVDAARAAVVVLQARYTQLTGQPAPGTTASPAVSAQTAAYSLSASPVQRNVAQSGSVAYTVSVFGAQTTDAVTFSATGLPKGVTVFFAPQTITGNGTSRATVNIDMTAAPRGLATIYLIGASLGGTARTSVSLVVGATSNLDAVGATAAAPLGGTVFGTGSGEPVNSGTLGGATTTPPQAPPGPNLDTATVAGNATTTFRYLAIKSVRDGWVSWREIEAYDAGGKKVIPKQAFVSCDWCNYNGPKPAGEAPSAVYDGDPSTTWGAGQTCDALARRSDGYYYCTGIAGGNTWRAWIILDYGSPQIFSKIRALPTGSSAREWDQVYVSQDGATFSKVTNFVGPATDNQWMEYDFPTSSGNPALTLSVNGGSSATVAWPTGQLSYRWMSSNIDYIDASFSMTDMLTSISTPGKMGCTATRNYVKRSVVPFPVFDPTADMVISAAALQYATSTTVGVSGAANNCGSLTATMTLHGVQSLTGKTVDQQIGFMIPAPTPVSWDFGPTPGVHLRATFSSTSGNTISVPVYEFSTYDVQPSVTITGIPSGLTAAYAALPAPQVDWSSTPSSGQIGTITVTRNGVGSGTYFLTLTGGSSLPGVDPAPRTAYVDVTIP